MTVSAYNVLFLCTGNSARSIMAETILNSFGDRRFRAYSAGSSPKDAVHPLTLELIEQLGLPTAGLRSKSWDEFAGPDDPRMDFVFTVCDQAASEPCPVWPGQPITAHWGMPDPAMAEGDAAQRMQAFRTAYRELEKRLRLFADLPMERLDRIRLQRELAEIGRGGE